MSAKTKLGKDLAAIVGTDRVRDRISLPIPNTSTFSASAISAQLVTKAL